MAKGKKTGGRDFEKGDPRAGRPKLSEDVKLLRKSTNEELIKILTLLMRSDEKTAKKIASDKKISMATMMLLTLVKNAIKKGDTNTINLIWDRIGEKMSNRQELTGKDGGPIEFDSDERKKRIAELLNKQE